MNTAQETYNLCQEILKMHFFLVDEEYRRYAFDEDRSDEDRSNEEDD